MLYNVIQAKDHTLPAIVEATFNGTSVNSEAEFVFILIEFNRKSLCNQLMFVMDSLKKNRCVCNDHWHTEDKNTH